MSKSTISNFQHVRVIPRPWSTSLKVFLVFSKVEFNRCPTIEYILCCPPAVWSLWCPSPRLFLTPLAQRKEYWSTSWSKRVSHRWISDHTGNSIVEAIVVLKVINSPVSEVLGIYDFVKQTSGTMRTGHGSCWWVNTEFETLAVDVVSKRLHSFREPLRVRNEMTIFSPFW